VVIWRAFLALAAGFAAMTVLALLLTALLARVAPGWTDENSKPSPAYAFASLGCSYLSAAVGGYLTAWTAAANPLVHVLTLALVVLGLAALNALQTRGKQPVWYQLAQVAIVPVGVLAGGITWLRVLGIL
jgi:heme A synthase